MKKRMITMAMAGVMAVSAMGGATVFAAQHQTADVKNICPNASIATSIVDKAAKQIKYLNLNFDNTKFELVQPEGSNQVFLMNKSDEKSKNTIVYISWQHADAVTAVKAAEDKIKEVKEYGDTAKIEKSDLQLESVKVVDHSKDGSSITYYFINDNNGGIYKVFVNTNAFAGKSEMTDILKSLSVDGKAADTMKIKKIAPCVG